MIDSEAKVSVVSFDFHVVFRARYALNYGAIDICVVYVRGRLMASGSTTLNVRFCDPGSKQLFPKN